MPTCIVELLPNRLVIASIKHSQIPSKSYALLHSILFASAHSSDYMFSLTRTEQEISLIIQHEQLENFKNTMSENNDFYDIERSNDIWRVIQVGQSECGAVDLEETIHVISDKLAKSKVSIFQLSTFEADFTLFREKDIEKVYKCLGDIVLFTNSDAWRFDQKVEDADIELNNMDMEMQMQMENSNNPVAIPIDGDEMVVTSSNRSYLEKNSLKPLLEIVFHSSQKTFFSVTIINSQVSYIMTQSQMKEFGLMNQSGNYRIIKVSGKDGGLGFDQVGIVADFTQPLSHLKTCFFYLSTFL